MSEGINENPVGRVAIFEDNPSIRVLYRLLVEFCKHEVVIEASTLNEALEEIDKRVTYLGNIALDGVLLDGNLGLGDTSNNDGRLIVEKLRQSPGGENIYIVNTTGTHMDIAGQSVRYRKEEAFEAVREIDEIIKRK